MAQSGNPNYKKQNELWGQQMGAAQDGDKRAYQQLLESTYPVLQKFVYGRINQKDQIDDIVQEVLLAMHRARHSYDRTRSFSAWMFAIASHKVIDYFRALKRQGNVVGEEEAFMDNIADDSNDNDRVAVRDELDRALSKLPPKMREAVEMLKLYGYSLKEAAYLLGVSVPAVKVSAHRGYKLLRKVMEARNG